MESHKVYVFVHFPSQWDNSLTSSCVTIRQITHISLVLFLSQTHGSAQIPAYLLSRYGWQFITWRSFQENRDAVYTLRYIPHHLPGNSVITLTMHEAFLSFRATSYHSLLMFLTWCGDTGFSFPGCSFPQRPLQHLENSLSLVKIWLERFASTSTDPECSMPQFQHCKVLSVCEDKNVTSSPKHDLTHHIWGLFSVPATRRWSDLHLCVWNAESPAEYTQPPLHSTLVLALNIKMKKKHWCIMTVFSLTGIHHDDILSNKGVLWSFPL